MEVRLAAKYPFLKESGSFLKSQGVTLDGIIKGKAYERARFAGKERVMEAINEPMIQDHPMATNADANNELLSYPVARMIVSAVGDPMLINRYAIAEAKKADKLLNNEGLPFVMQVAADLGLDVSDKGGEITIDFADFLRFSAALRSKEWKLINQRVKGARVLVPNKKKLVRLVQQLITERISSELPLPVNDDIISAFDPDIGEIRAIYEQKRAEQRSRDVGKLSIMRFPPCMGKLLGMMQAGENCAALRQVRPRGVPSHARHELGRGPRDFLDRARLRRDQEQVPDPAHHRRDIWHGVHAPGVLDHEELRDMLRPRFAVREGVDEPPSEVLQAEGQAARAEGREEERRSRRTQGSDFQIVCALCIAVMLPAMPK